MIFIFLSSSGRPNIKVFEKKKIMPISTSSRTREGKSFPFEGWAAQKEIFFAHKCKKARTREKEGRKKSHKYFGSETYVKFHTSLLYITISGELLSSLWTCTSICSTFSSRFHPSPYFLPNSFSIFTTKWLAVSINHVANRKLRTFQCAIRGMR